MHSPGTRSRHQLSLPAGGRLPAVWPCVLHARTPLGTMSVLLRSGRLLRVLRRWPTTAPRGPGFQACGCSCSSDGARPSARTPFSPGLSPPVPTRLCTPYRAQSVQRLSCASNLSVKCGRHFTHPHPRRRALRVRGATTGPERSACVARRGALSSFPSAGEAGHTLQPQARSTPGYGVSKRQRRQFWLVGSQGLLFSCTLFSKNG